MSEFKALLSHTSELEAALEQAAAGAPHARLAALEAALTQLDALTPRLAVFEKRAREKDPDRKVYGPKMVEQVLQLIERVKGLREHADEVAEALRPMREEREAEMRAIERRKQAEVEAAAAAQRETADAVRAERARAEREARAAREAAKEAERKQVEERLKLIAEGATGLDARRGAAPAPEHGLSLLDAEAKLRRNCSPPEHREALQALHLFASNAVAHPEDGHFRSIRLLNEHFQHAVARHPGGVEVLLALGFVERETLEGDTSILHYVMEEPPIENIDAWARWFDSIKERRDALGTIMLSEGIRILPTATKAAARAADTPAAAATHRTSKTMDIQVLHGQSGGGI